jgi:hypothetical protein
VIIMAMFGKIRRMGFRDGLSLLDMFAAHESVAQHHQGLADAAAGHGAEVSA